MTLPASLNTYRKASFSQTAEIGRRREELTEILGDKTLDNATWETTFNQVRKLRDASGGICQCLVLKWLKKKIKET